MLRQIKQLTKVQLCNLFGINEVRYTKDKKKKKVFVGMACAWLLVFLMMMGYMVLLSLGFVQMGMAQIVPVYLFAITSIFILVFSFFKASSIIFQMKTYEMLISLPVKKTAIVVSRFFTMYVTNLFVSLLVMLPGTIIYGIFVKPEVSFYIYSLLGVVFLPFLPLTIATAIGAVITAISSRMRHKSLVATALTILFVLAIVMLSLVFSGSAEKLTEEMVKNYAGMMTDQIAKLYPPAIWFGNGAVNGSFSSFLLFSLSSVVLFAAMVAILQKYFMKICAALNATSAKNNFKMQSLLVSSPVKALWKREMKRYFASSIYVTNTIMGYLLMAVFGIALFVIGSEKLEEMLEIPGVIVKLLPFLLGLLAAMMPTTACSISMEGKWWWIAQTLPVKSKHIFDSKILVNLSVSFPFYVLAVLFSIIAVKPSPLEAFFIIVVPASYLIFSSVAGIAVNLAVPVFNWENETRVVKQSASIMFTMLISFVCSLPPFICILVFQAPEHLVMAVTTAVLLGLSAVLYIKNNKKEIIRIQ